MAVNPIDPFFLPTMLLFSEVADIGLCVLFHHPLFIR